MLSQTVDSQVSRELRHQKSHLWRILRRLLTDCRPPERGACSFHMDVNVILTGNLTTDSEKAKDSRSSIMLKEERYRDGGREE